MEIQWLSKYETHSRVNIPRQCTHNLNKTTFTIAISIITKKHVPKIFIEKHGLIVHGSMQSPVEHPLSIP
jgi:hypothetical protein